MVSFGAVMDSFTSFYSNGSYAQALELVTNELPNNPNYEAVLRCFQIAMLSRLGELPETLNKLRAALEKGYWYHEGALRGDPDFAPLQEMPEFKALVEKSANLRQNAVANAIPVLSILEPQTPPPWPALIVLHGNLSNVDTFADYWKPAQDAGWLVALPQSPHMSWLSGFYDWTDPEAAFNLVTRLYTDLIVRYSIDTNRVLVAGFSSGALLAEQIALSKKIPAQSLCWIEGSPDKDIEQLLSTHQPTDIRAYMIAGQSQDFIQSAEAIHTQFASHGIQSIIEHVPTPYHDMPDNFPQILERALKFLSP